MITATTGKKKEKFNVLLHYRYYSMYYETRVHTCARTDAHLEHISPIILQPCKLAVTG